MSSGNNNTISSSSSSSRVSSKDLCDAILGGDLLLFGELLKKDQCIFHRPPVVPSCPGVVLPLHLACRLEHLELASELLDRYPDLTDTVDPYDQSSTPLHLAARNGNLQLVKLLVGVNPGICFVNDSQGRNPVHVAAVRSNIEVLREFLDDFPAAAREINVPAAGGRRDTIMHLCAKQDKLEALKLLVEKMGSDEAMLNAGDGYGNTILHIAVANRQLQMIDFLLRNKNILKNAQNMYGLTPMDIFSQQKQIPNPLDPTINRILIEAKALRARDLPSTRAKYFGSWMAKQQSGLMIVASLVATMAFQAGTNPASFWVETPTSDNFEEHKRSFVIFNTIGFVFAMFSLFWFISGIPFNRFSVAIIMPAMLGASMAMVCVYGNSLSFFGLNREAKHVGILSSLWMFGCAGLIWFFTEIIRVLMNKANPVGTLVAKFLTMICFSREGNGAPLT